MSKNVNDVVRNAVAEALLVNPEYTARELKREAEKILRQKGFNYKYTERTYLNLKKELSPKAGPTDLDKPWTIGCCVKANIPAEMIPKLLWEKEFLQKHPPKITGKHRKIIIDQISKMNLQITVDDFEKIYQRNHALTIRVAQWYAKIYPTVMELAKRSIDNWQEAEGQVKAESGVYPFALELARIERIAEMLGETYPDTSDMDEYLIYGKLEIGDTPGLAVFSSMMEEFAELIKGSKTK